MQNILAIKGSVARLSMVPFDSKTCAAGFKRLAVSVWLRIRWILELAFAPPPGQEFIEESRMKAFRCMGRI